MAWDHRRVRFRGGVEGGTQVWLMAAAVVAVLVLAASTGSVRLWTHSAGDGEQPVAEVEPIETAQPPVRDESAGRDIASGDRLLDVLAGVVITALAVGAGVIAVRELALGGWTGSPLRLRRRRGKILAVIPEATPQQMTVDVDAARAVLSAGAPRNAIIGCWIQLEHDAARVGLARFEAETSSEYVERVVAASSVDAVPISELAGLYREARFSRHELTDAHRARAMELLVAVIAAMDRPMAEVL